VCSGEGRTAVWEVSNQEDFDIYEEYSKERIRADELFGIAADLLDALERLVYLADERTWPGPNTLAQARAAIAKAKADAAS
jgi:hypothetical protein